MKNYWKSIFNFATSSNTSSSALNDGDPDVAEDPNVTEDPDVAEDPKVTEDPKFTEDPKVTKDSKHTKDPNFTKDPDITKYPKVTTDPKVTKALNVTVTEDLNGTEDVIITEDPEVTTDVTVTEDPKPPKFFVWEKLESNLGPDIQPLKTFASTSSKPSSSDTSDVKPEDENCCPPKEKYFDDRRKQENLYYIEAPNTYETYRNLLKTLLHCVIPIAADQQVKVWKAELEEKFATSNSNPRQRKKARNALNQKIKDIYSPKITYTRLLELGKVISKAGLPVDQQAQLALDSIVKIRTMMSWDRPSISKDSPAGIRETREGRGKGKASDSENTGEFGKAKDIRTIIDNHREIYHILTQLRQLLVRDDKPAQNLQKDANTGNNKAEENRAQNDELLQHKIAKQEDSNPERVHKLEDYEISFPSYPWVQGDLYFQVLCFLKDSRVIHDLCEACWKTVKPLGETSRVTASLTTKQAVKLIHSLEDQVSKPYISYVN
jgi:hypothetical protein